jgi:hypothetical protein
LGSSWPGNWTGLKIEGSASVLRSASALASNPPAPAGPRPLPVACRQISRNCSPTFTRTFLLRRPNNKKGTAPERAMPFLADSYQPSAISYPFELTPEGWKLAARRYQLLTHKTNPTTKSRNYLQTLFIIFFTACNR